jgi:serine/threonine protein kinase
VNGHKNSGNYQFIQVASIIGKSIRLEDMSHEDWSFLETGRSQKTFETLDELGTGGCGTVSKVRHKLDSRIYALKKVNFHIKFAPEEQKSILNHPAMKEIQAISKLSHKNIVGYKGCWVEAENPDLDRLERILKKIHKRRGVDE